jgi:hypothetical protein
VLDSTRPDRQGRVSGAPTSKAVPSTSYGPSPTRRSRRTKSDMERIRNGLYEILDDQHPATVRGTFYQAVSRGLVAKTEGEYKTTVGRLLTEMRRAGELPYGWIADNTRWMRKPQTYSSLEDMLRLTAQTYRRALWGSQDAYVEVWSEKDAIAGVLYEVTEHWDVPLMVTRGYPSITYLYGAAEAIADQGKPVFIYYLGDHDPSGVDIARFVEKELRQLAPGADITFEKIAVTTAQIDKLRLLTRPTKKSDSRSRNFQGDSVEVDAIPAPFLRQLVAEHIEQHVDRDALNRLLGVEAAEAETLTNIVAGMRGAG